MTPRESFGLFQLLPKVYVSHPIFTRIEEIQARPTNTKSFCMYIRSSTLISINQSDTTDSGCANFLKDMLSKKDKAFQI